MTCAYFNLNVRGRSSSRKAGGGDTDHRRAGRLKFFLEKIAHWGGRDSRRRVQETFSAEGWSGARTAVDDGMS